MIEGDVALMPLTQTDGRTQLRPVILLRQGPPLGIGWFAVSARSFIGKSSISTTRSDRLIPTLAEVALRQRR